MGGSSLQVDDGLEVRLSHYTASDAKRLLGQAPTLLLPLGSHEDQGPHAPMGDFLLAERIAILGARAAHRHGTPCYVLPVIPYGGDDFFRSAVGGAVLRQSTMVAVLDDVLGTLADNGCNRILIVNGHGGNVEPIRQATRALLKRSILIPSLYIWEAAYRILTKVVGDKEAAHRAGHGADPLGSVLLHVAPELARPDYAPAQRPLKSDPYFGMPFLTLGSIDLNGVTVGLPSEYDVTFNDGVAAGDPSACDAKTGEVITNQIVDAIADLAARLSRRSAE